MKKYFLLIAVTLVCLLTLAACGTSGANRVIFTSDGEIVAVYQYLKANTIDPSPAVEKEDHDFVEWKLTETLEDGTRVYDAVWIHSNILYTITYDYLGVITEQ
ncbi:MAG: hypothetical protein PHX51_06545, partial [Clostridia bacterium]|nr:hypothetical protein [Clostridia bacterium]